MVEYNKIIVLKEYLKDIWHDWKVEDVETYTANITHTDYPSEKEDLRKIRKTMILYKK